MDQSSRGVSENGGIRVVLEFTVVSIIRGSDKSGLNATIAATARTINDRGAMEKCDSLRTAVGDITRYKHGSQATSAH